METQGTQNKGRDRDDVSTSRGSAARERNPLAQPAPGAQNLQATT